MKFGVVIFPGSNCDHDAYHALSHNLGKNAAYLWHQSEDLEGCDAVILPGGFGTLEELFEVLAWQTLKLHTKPILLLNTAGFYNPMLAFLDHCVTEGVLKQKNREILLVADTVEDALKQLGIA